MKHDFEQRKQNRIDHARQKAQKNKESAKSLHASADKMASFIPMGQPVLVGHHSEKRHRNHLQKIRNTVKKAFEASDKASYYEEKAETIENNTAIFSDDPNALEKINAKIDKLEKLQEFMKSANKLIRKNDKEGFMKFEGATEQLWETLNQPDCFGNTGFASYKLSNNNANIRRLKSRRDKLQRTETMQSETEEIKGVRLVKNVEANRVQLIFRDKPSDKVRDDLWKVYHFRWCGSEGAWQRHLNNAGLYAAKQFLEKYQADS